MDEDAMTPTLAEFERLLDAHALALREHAPEMGAGPKYRTRLALLEFVRGVLEDKDHKIAALVAAARDALARKKQEHEWRMNAEERVRDLEQERARAKEGRS